MTAGAQLVADERCGYAVTATELEHAVAGLDVEFLDRPPLAFRCPAHGVLPGRLGRPSLLDRSRVPGVRAGQVVDDDRGATRTGRPSRNHFVRLRSPPADVDRVVLLATWATRPRSRIDSIRSRSQRP